MLVTVAEWKVEERPNPSKKNHPMEKRGSTRGKKIKISKKKKLAFKTH